MSSDIQRANAAVAECKALMSPYAPDMFGSDLSVLIDKIVAWVKTLDLGGYGTPALDVIYHLIVDTLLPWTLDLAPAYVKVAVNSIVVPLLKKWHDANLPHTA